MSVCPKSAWGGVKALLHSVFDQIDADAVHTQYDRLLAHTTNGPTDSATSAWGSSPKPD